MFILGMNPFFAAYGQADWFGRVIFLSLFFLSVLSWVILIQKVWTTRQTFGLARSFHRQFRERRLHPLSLESQQGKSGESRHSFQNLYIQLKRQTLELLSKNRHHAETTKVSQGEEVKTYLSPTDLELIESYLYSGISQETKYLDRNLFILSTVASLAPFLGLLGTVWGILLTFSELQSKASLASSNQMVLSGLAMALATTVLGLVIAIPALVGYNFLKDRVRAFAVDMENFASEMVSAVELQYRKVDVV